MSCTEFCNRIATLHLDNCLIPSRQQLIEHLPPVDEDGGWYLGTWHELQQRTQCAFCQLATTAVLNNVGGLGNIEAAESNQAISVLVFPEEQSFRLSYPSRLGTRIAFVAGNETQATSPDTARLLSNSGVDTKRIRKWLQACEDSHNTCRLPKVNLNDKQKQFLSHKSFREDLTSNFRVIDLERNCLTSAALDVRYVSLSYVWGQLQMYKLQKNDLDRLLQDNSLESIRATLPNTINDAIDLVKALGERYLWIDGLCLMQDDSIDVMKGIRMMNSIYTGSYFTIIAGSGHNADAGLPGIRAPAKVREKFVSQIAPSVHMTVLHGIDWHLSRSAHSRRGWCLQETVLPRRAVIFVNGQIHFRCQEANWCEETWADKWTHALDPDDSNIWRIPNTREGHLPSLWAYQKLCEDFSHRKLRDDGDALRALTGIIRPLAAGMETSTVEGLPAYYLEHFLLWKASDCGLRRRDRFASFSWAGWEGQVTFPRENFVWHEQTADGNIFTTQTTPNIVHYFKDCRIVEWHSLKSNADRSSLSTRSYGEPSLLLKAMQEHAHIFHIHTATKSPETKYRSLHNQEWSIGDRSTSSIPKWDDIPTPANSTEITDDPKTWPLHNRKRLSIHEFNLANGQAEFERIIPRIENENERRWLNNWMAGRNFTIHRFDYISKEQYRGPNASSCLAEDMSSYRAPRVAHNASEDKRVKVGLENYQRRIEHNEETSLGPPVIPKFPPYTVLQFITISLHLTLGPLPQPQPQPTPPNGVPLLSETGSTVGFLHPDNIDLLPAQGSPLELIVVARSHTPMAESAL